MALISYLPSNAARLRCAFESRRSRHDDRLAANDDQSVLELRTEPHTNLCDRVSADLMKLLPIDSQL